MQGPVLRYRKLEVRLGPPDRTDGSRICAGTAGCLPIQVAHTLHSLQVNHLIVRGTLAVE